MNNFKPNIALFLVCKALVLRASYSSVGEIKNKGAVEETIEVITVEPVIVDPIIIDPYVYD
jgi:hypothetical protein